MTEMVENSPENVEEHSGNTIMGYQKFSENKNGVSGCSPKKKGEQQPETSCLEIRKFS